MEPNNATGSSEEVQIDERLLKAAISGNASEMKDLVERNPKILLGTTPQRSTCLHISSIYGYEEFTKYVLALNRSLLSMVNSYGETPLIVAVTGGHVSLASTLLQHCKQLGLSDSILQSDNNGDNALHHAIRNGHKDLALELITAEPDLSEGVNRYKESPMYIAVLRGFTDVFVRLLEIPGAAYGGTFGHNALHAAVKNRNPGIAKQIMDKYPSLAREENMIGNTPLQLCALWNKPDVVRVLLEHDRSLGYLVNSINGAPPLVSAAYRGQVDIAQQILDFCPDAPYCNESVGWTILHAAVFEGHLEFVEFILRTPKLRKLINMRDIYGKTALHYAVLKCNPKIVRALLSHKDTDPTIPDIRGVSASFQLGLIQENAKTLNWNEVFMLMSKADSQAPIYISRLEAKKDMTAKSMQEIKSLTRTYISNTSLVAILIATVTFAAAFTLPGGYSNDPGSEGLPAMAKKFALKAFLISDTLAMCSSLAVAFTCILARWQDLKFLLYYRSFTKKLMWFAYMATTLAFATGLYTVLAPQNLWLAILICLLSISLPFLTKLLGEWPIVKLRFRLGHAFQSDFLDMV